MLWETEETDETEDARASFGFHAILGFFGFLGFLGLMQRHFTATAFVIQDGRALLMWHERMQRWMPPGGHVDENELPEETARRECKEETGLDVEIVGDVQPDLFAGYSREGQMLKRPFAMLLENIPASESRGEPPHQHMDFLFLAKPLDSAQELVLATAEGRELRWFTRDEISALPDAEIFGNVRAYLMKFLAS